MSSVFGGFGGGGSVSGGLAGGGSIPAFAAGGRIPARAGGGPVLVGERGPELFIPHSGGVIKNKMDTKIEEGNLRHKKVSGDLVGDFKKWRSSQNLTQKDVAVKLSVQSQLINKFETGQLNHNPQLIGKIKRLMNI